MTTTSTLGIKPLSSYLDLDKVSKLPQQELEYIWRLRHASDPQSLCAVVPLQTYTRIYRTARQHPKFILPLPRPNATQIGARHDDDDNDDNDTSTTHSKTAAADIHFLQWTFHPPAIPPPPNSHTSNTHTSTVIFTHLASFKAHGENAQPHTTIVHHLDLADSHGLVLLNGAVAKDKGLTVEEGKWLLMCLQKFYDHEGQGGQDAGSQRRGLLEKFSQGDRDFRVETLLDEAARFS